MQALCSWLQRTKNVHVHQEWVEACMQWIQEEETQLYFLRLRKTHLGELDLLNYFSIMLYCGQGVSQHILQQMVYDQWLYADLREVASQTCMPSTILELHICQISGTFVVQLDSVADVGSSAYGQLQKLKGQSLDQPESSDSKRNYDPKPSRLLLLSLTDGTINFQAMEYHTIPQLNPNLTPGTKLQLQGTIDCRLGTLLLTASHVQVMGGGVEQLTEQNQPRRVLARILNNESLAEESNAGSRPPSRASSQPANDSRPQEGAVTEMEQVGSIQEGDLDLEHFDDFGEAEELSQNAGEEWEEEEELDLVMEEHFQQEQVFEYEAQEELISGASVLPPPPEKCKASSTAKQDLLQPRVALEQPSRVPPAISGCTIPGLSSRTESRSAKVSHSKHESPAMNTESSTLSKKLLVASVKPMAEAGESSMDHTPIISSGTTVTLDSLISVDEAWKLRPVVRIKAHFVKVTGKLKPSSGQWTVTVLIGDSNGKQRNVQLSNQVLEKLIGFTAREFTEHIQPKQKDPAVKARGSTGFKHCQSALVDLNCYMEIRRPTTTDLPLVERLLDS